MKKFAVLAIVAIALIGCNQKKQPTTQEMAGKQQTEQKQKTKTEPQLPTTNDSTLVVDNEHAIMFMADTLELNEIAEKYGPEGLAEAASDMSYYAMTASDIIDTLGIETTISDKKYLILINPDQSQTKIERKKVKEGDVVLFKPGKNPLFTWAAGFEKKTALEYFEIEK